MKFYQIIVLFLVLSILTYSLTFYIYETHSLVIPENNQKEEYHLTLGMVGDALYHSGTYKDGLQKDGTYNFDYQLETIKPIIANYDLAYYNQESILGGVPLGLSNYPRFNSPKEVGDAFINAGFDLVSLANNHTWDKGERGIINSLNYWQNKPVITSGSYDSFKAQETIPTYEKNNITYAFLSYTYGTNGISIPSGKEYLVNLFDYDKVTKDVISIRDKVDIVLVAMHWGVEYTHNPTNEQRKQAEFLASLGVDVIIGSHPHVIQPIEHIGKSVVIYSLGNFISGQDGIAKRIGLLASLDIHKTIENNNTTITIDNIKGDLVYTYRTNNYRNFKVIPFCKLNNELLENYENLKVKYEKIINQNDTSVQVGNLQCNY